MPCRARPCRAVPADTLHIEKVDRVGFEVIVKLKWTYFNLIKMSERALKSVILKMFFLGISPVARNCVRICFVNLIS